MGMEMMCIMSKKGDCWGSTGAKSFATLKRELVEGRHFETREQAELAVFTYTAGYCRRT